MDDDKTVILCNRVANVPSPGIDGCTRDRCSRCAEEVWISPTTQMIKESDKAIVMCFECAGPEIKKTGAKIEIRPSQIEEVRNQIRRNIAKN